MRNKKAFTLIELLVVVLIIGILSAIALPQYQKAVLKSRVVGALPNVKYLIDQVEIYRLANGEYPPDQLKDVMDVALSSCSGGNGGRYLCKNYGIDYEGFDPSNPYVRVCFPDCSETTTHTMILHYGLKSQSRGCSSSIGFCKLIKGIWQD